MIVSKETLLREAASTDFRPDMLEKVIALQDLLQKLRSHPFLKDRIALKGGTALNLFAFDLPRLSVDIDLNYIGSADLSTMQQERPKIEDSINAVVSREGFSARRIPDKHAGGKWVLTFPSALGGGGTLELDMNFMFRIPLWPVSILDSCAVGAYRSMNIPVADIHEVAGGKLAALVSRDASRDLFDARQILTQLRLNRAKLRVAFVVFGTMNKKDWRKVSLDDIQFTQRELQENLLPLLRQEYVKRMGSAAKWAKELVEECRDEMKAVLPLNKDELEFLSRIFTKGQIEPDLITDDKALAERIRNHPNLQWQIEKFRKFGQRK